MRCNPTLRKNCPHLAVRMSVLGVSVFLEFKVAEEKGWGLWPLYLQRPSNTKLRRGFHPILTHPRAPVRCWHFLAKAPSGRSACLALKACEGEDTRTNAQIIKKKAAGLPSYKTAKESPSGSTDMAGQNDKGRTGSGSTDTMGLVRKSEVLISFPIRFQNDIFQIQHCKC